MAQSVPPEGLTVIDNTQAGKPAKICNERLEQLKLIPLVKNLYKEFDESKFEVKGEQFCGKVADIQLAFRTKEKKVEQNQVQILGLINSSFKKGELLRIAPFIQKDTVSKVREVKRQKQRVGQLTASANDLLLQLQQLQAAIIRAIGEKINQTRQG